MAKIKFGLKSNGKKTVITPSNVMIEPGDRLQFDGGSDAKGNKKTTILIPNDNVISVHADIKFPMSAIVVQDVKIDGKHDFEVSFADPGGNDDPTQSH